MKLRTLALACLGLAGIVLVLVSLAGYQSWREVSQDYRDVARSSSLHDRIRRLEVAIDYVTLLRKNLGILTDIGTDARGIAEELRPIDHPATTLGRRHLEEIAFMSEELTVDSLEIPIEGTGIPAEPSMTAFTSQLLIHQAGARDALETILADRNEHATLTMVRFLGVALIALVVLAALAVLAFAIIYRRLGAPLRAIQQGIEDMGPGHRHKPIAVTRKDELGQLAAAFNRVAEERNRYEASLVESDRRFRQLAENVREVFWIMDAKEQQLLYVSPAYEAIWGRSVESLYEDPAQWMASIHPEDRQRLREKMEKKWLQVRSNEYRITRPDGEERWIGAEVYPVTNASGEVVQVLGVARDITERVSLGRQLEESQRLEALGQLTGGVAHDFNNLLTVIMGNAEVLDERLAGDARLHPLAAMISSAAQRGAELTQRLLAFARKQPLAPEAVDINRLLAGMDTMLRRTLGGDIELEMTRGAGLWPAMADPAQLESAVLNLCLNARDAMPDGGKLTVESANVFVNDDYADSHPGVTPGQYVMVAVSDTGTGIPREQLERVFEPFFSTKEKGKGTGLGLSMVYGFAKQSNGHVKIYSEPGEGSTVRLYLPRFTGEIGQESRRDPPAEVVGGVETVLLVEDDEMVMEYGETQLKSLGYHVLTAGNGAEALEVIRHREDIDLLFTDVVMPGGMSGRGLADAAWQIRPDLPVLYTSGYTENAIVHHGRLDPGVQLLAKPYRRAELAKRVRAALARRG